MEDYSYLFQSEKIYSENILSFYNFFYKENPLEYINNSVLENPFFLYLVYPSEKIIKELFYKNDLLRFRFIDFFTENLDLIDQREIKINNFLKNNDIAHIENIFSKIKTDIDIKYMNEIKYLIDDVVENKEMYLNWLINKTFKIYFSRSFINIKLLSVRLLILYYFNKFFIKERSYQLKTDDPDYIEFTRLLIKYRDFYSINLDYTSIKFKNDDTPTPNLTTKEYLLMRFFDSLRNPSLIDRKIITWFYIFFSDDIPNEIQNDILYIILGSNVKKNTIGLIMQILKAYNKDYSELSEEEKEDIIKNIKNDYVFKQSEFPSNFNYDDYINNILLIKKLSDNNENYEFLKNINYDDIENNNLFFILHCDPLEETWSSIKNKILKIETKFNNLNLPVEKLIKIYNSITYTDINKKEINVIKKDGEYVLEDIGILLESSPSLFDGNILFYNFILFLNNYEILLLNNKTDVINNIKSYNTNIETLKNIFKSIKPNKDFYNGYQRFK